MTNPNATVTNQINKPAGAPVLAKPAVESVIANAPVKESPPAAIAEVPKAPMLPGDRIPAN